MKKMKQFYTACFILAALCITTLAFGQDPTGELPPVTDLTPSNIFTMLINPVYSALVVIFGYVAYLIPGVNKFAPFIRVAAFALVAGLGFILYGVADFWQIAITYFFTTGLYDLFLRKILPSPKGSALAASTV